MIILRNRFVFKLFSVHTKTKGRPEYSNSFALKSFFEKLRLRDGLAWRPDRPKRPWQTRTHCCGHIVADTNVSPFGSACYICCGHKFESGIQKMFLILFRNILCPQQMFPSLRSPRNIMSNNVSTMCPRLPGP